MSCARWNTAVVLHWALVPALPATYPTWSKGSVAHCIRHQWIISARRAGAISVSLVILYAARCTPADTYSSLINIWANGCLSCRQYVIKQRRMKSMRMTSYIYFQLQLSSLSCTFDFNVHRISGWLPVPSSLILVHSDPSNPSVPGRIFCWIIQCNWTRTTHCTCRIRIHKSPSWVPPQDVSGHAHRLKCPLGGRAPVSHSKCY